jgi:hypothetical protein
LRPGREGRLSGDRSDRPPIALTPAIVLWRVTHGLITAAFLSAIAAIWTAAVTGRRGRWLRAAITAVLCEGAVVALNHGDCPLGPVGERVGDPVPFFELLLSPRAARRAIPALGAFTAVGVAIVAARGGRSSTRWS